MEVPATPPCYGKCEYGATCGCDPSVVLRQDYESEYNPDSDADTDLSSDDEPGANVVATDDMPCLATFAKRVVGQERLSTATRFDVPTTMALAYAASDIVAARSEMLVLLRRWKRVIEARLDDYVINNADRTVTVQEGVYRYFMCNGTRESLTMHQIQDLGVAAAAIMVLPLPFAMQTVLSILDDRRNRHSSPTLNARKRHPCTTTLSHAVSGAAVLAYLLPCIVQYEMDIPWPDDFAIIRVGSQVLCSTPPGSTMPAFPIDDDMPAFQWCNFVKACVFYTFWTFHRLPTPVCARYGSVNTAALIDLFENGKVVPSSFHAAVRVTALRSLLNARRLHRGPWRGLCVIMKHVKRVVRYNLYTFLMWRDGVLSELTSEEAVDDYVATFYVKHDAALALDKQRSEARAANVDRPPKLLASFCAQYNDAGMPGTTTLECVRWYVTRTLLKARHAYLNECKQYIGRDLGGFLPTVVLDLIFEKSFI